MDHHDRYRILKNLQVLISGVNVELIIPYLFSQGIIFKEDVDFIKSKYIGRDEKAQEFFLNYCTRGPNAFGILVNALKNHGYVQEVKSLLGEDIGKSEYLLTLTRLSSNNIESSPIGKMKLLTAINETVLLNGNGIGHDLIVDNANETSANKEFKDDERIQHANLYNQGISDSESAYPMMSRPKGFALIINNINFPGSPGEKRLGAESDSDNLYRLLTDLGYRVTHNLIDVQKRELLDPDIGILKKFKEQFDTPDKVDSCFVAFMSHGEDGWLKTSDFTVMNDPYANYVNIERDILTRFNNLHCHALIGKPKIFVIPSCRGYERDRGVRLASRTKEDFVNDEDRLMREPPSGVKIPEWGDMIICFSTVPGKVSNRDVVLGTWYIETLCKIWRLHAHNTDLIHLLQMVSRELEQIRSENGEKQMSEFIHRGFNKDFYFNPGIYAEP